MLKQLDFIRIGKALQRWILQSRVLTFADVGSDHKPVLLQMAAPIATNPAPKQKHQSRGRRCVPDGNYEVEVERRLAQTWGEKLDATLRLSLHWQRDLLQFQ